MILQCPKDMVLLIEGASYGIPAQSCAAPDTFDIVRKMCSHRNSCTLSAKDDPFGDPCSGNKHLTVKYYCQGNHGGSGCNHGNH